MRASYANGSLIVKGSQKTASTPQSQLFRWKTEPKQNQTDAHPHTTNMSPMPYRWAKLAQENHSQMGSWTDLSITGCAHLALPCPQCHRPAGRCPWSLSAAVECSPPSPPPWQTVVTVPCAHSGWTAFPEPPGGQDLQTHDLGMGFLCSCFHSLDVSQSAVTGSCKNVQYTEWKRRKKQKEKKEKKKEALMDNWACQTDWMQSTIYIFKHLLLDLSKLQNKSYTCTPVLIYGNKGNIRETFERQGGADTGFSEHTDTILE